MMKKELLQGTYLMYQGKPLVREKNAYCYGDMQDKAVLFLLVLTNKEVDGRELPDRVLIQLLSTDPKLDNAHKLLKQGEKNGLYQALDTGLVWLKKELTA